MKLGGIILLAIICQIHKLQAQQIINRVLCRDVSSRETIQCDNNEIIDVQSVTVAVVGNQNPCTTQRLVTVIGNLAEQCKRSLKTPDYTDGEEIYKRCHGERRCTIDNTMVPAKYLSDTQCAYSYSNVLQFSYRCLQVREHLTLPMKERREIHGTSIHIFSPNYPCNRPEGIFQIVCTVAPQRTISGTAVTFKIRLKLVWFQPAPNRCSDYLYFLRDLDPDSDPVTPYYCNGGTRRAEDWNSEIQEVAHDMTLNYITSSDNPGAKFWLIVEATENRVPVELNVTCSWQGTATQPEPCNLLTPSPPPPPSPTSSPAIQPSPTPSSPTPPPASPIPSTNDGNKEKADNTVLYGVLGGVLGLVVIVACVAVFLFCTIRKKKRQTAQKRVPPITPPRRPRPKSIQKIKALVQGKSKAPNPDEENAIEETKETKTKQKPQKPPKPNSGKKMSAVLKSKGETPKPSEEKSTEVKPEKVAVVQPYQMYATVDKKKKKDEPSEEPDVEDNVDTYAVPKKDKKTVQSYDNAPDLRKKEVDETVMFDNDDLYRRGNEVSNEDNENVKSQTANDVENENNESDNDAEWNDTD